MHGGGVGGIETLGFLRTHRFRRLRALGALALLGVWGGGIATVAMDRILRIASYRHNAAIYGQNKHAHANLRRIMGLERVARAWGGLIQPLS